MARVEIKALPPQEAIRFFESKKLKVSFDWRDVWQQEHAHAFTVAKAARADILADIHEAVDDAIREGTTLHQFRKQLTPLLQKKGWWGKRTLVDPATGEKVVAQLGSPHRLRTIFDTNLRMSYAAGRWERVERLKKRMPYLRYSAVRDSRTRAAHAGWHGTILPVDDPFWETHAPPNGWHCRCKLIQLSDRQMKRREFKPSPAPEIKTRPWTNKRTGETIEVPEGIAPGFAYNVGRTRRGFKGPPPPPPDPNKIPELDETVALERFVAGAKGSNEGGIYRGSDGVTRYVKFYDDPAQAYSEAVSNRIYRELGFEAPRSALVPRKGKIALANEMIENAGTLGSAGLTKARAEKVLQGLAADVWLANWDAVGLQLDNVLVAGSKLARVDQGGSLLFRARAGRKPLERLGKISEWDGFADSTRNPAYAKVFRKAGLASADELGRKALNRIAAIKKLGQRTNDFADLVPAVKGVPAADRKAILELLRKRARLLETAIAPRIREALRQAANVPAHEAALMRAMGARYQKFRSEALKKLRAGAPRHGLSDPELTAIYAYTTNDGRWSYKYLNEALRSDDPVRRAKVEPHRRTLEAALAKLPDYEGIVKRKTGLTKEDLAKYKFGEIVQEPAFTSTSADGEAAFSGPHHFLVKSRHGKRIQPYSGHPAEREVLFPPSARFEVTRVKAVSGGGLQVEMTEID